MSGSEKRKPLDDETGGLGLAGCFASYGNGDGYCGACICGWGETCWCSFGPTTVTRPLTDWRSSPSTTGSEASRTSRGFLWLSGVLGGMGGGSDVTRRRLGEGGVYMRCDDRWGDCRTSWCVSIWRITDEYHDATSIGRASYFLMNGCSSSFLYFGRFL